MSESEVTVAQYKSVLMREYALNQQHNTLIFVPGKA